MRRALLIILSSWICLTLIWGLSLPRGERGVGHALRHELHLVLDASDGDDPDSSRERAGREGVPLRRVHLEREPSI